MEGRGVSADAYALRTRGGGYNSSSTLVPMREQDNAYKGVFLLREKGGKIGQKKKGVFFFKLWEKSAWKGSCFVNFGIAH